MRSGHLQSAAFIILQISDEAKDEILDNTSVQCFAVIDTRTCEVGLLYLLCK